MRNFDKLRLLLLVPSALLLTTGCVNKPLYDFPVPTEVRTLQSPSPRIPKGHLPGMWDPGDYVGEGDSPFSNSRNKQFMQTVMRCGQIEDDEDEEKERCDPAKTVDSMQSDIFAMSPYASTVTDSLINARHSFTLQMSLTLSDLSGDPEEDLLYWTKDEHDPHPALFRNQLLNERIRLNYVPDQATWRHLAENHLDIIVIHPVKMNEPVRIKVVSFANTRIAFKILRQSATLPFALRADPRIKCDRPGVKIPRGMVCSMSWYDESRYWDKAPWSSTPVRFPLVVAPNSDGQYYRYAYQGLNFVPPDVVAKKRAQLTVNG